MQDTTALATVWNDPVMGRVNRARYELVENFRPVWRSAGTAGSRTCTTSTLDRPLASLLVLHLSRRGNLHTATGLRLPESPRQPLPLDERQARAVYAACAGLAVTVVRFQCSCVHDDEVVDLQRAGIAIDLLDAASMQPESR